MRHLEPKTLEEFERQACAAFNRAIRSGRMSEADAPDYMFMGFDPQGRACFKHRDTRLYLAHKVTP